jgi:tRNA A37 N6-isopentenylltransferase MiaA
VAEEILVHTRQYAKRQLTWFRKRPGVPIEDLSETDKIQEILQKTVSLFKGFF